MDAPARRIDQAQPPGWTPDDPKVGWWSIPMFSMAGYPGYFYDRTPDPVHTRPEAHPYGGDGLDAAIIEAAMGTDNDLAQRAIDALQRSLGPGTAYAQCIDINALADPTWVAALNHLAVGRSLNEAWNGVQPGGMSGLSSPPSFSLETLAAGKQRIDTLRVGG